MHQNVEIRREALICKGRQKERTSHTLVRGKQTKVALGYFPQSFFLIHYCLLLELNQELQFSSNGISNKVNIFVFSLLLLRNQKVKEKCIKHDQRKERWLFSCNFLYILMIKARLSVFDFAHFRWILAMLLLYICVLPGYSMTVHLYIVQ